MKWSGLFYTFLPSFWFQLLKCKFVFLISSILGLWETVSDQKFSYFFWHFKRPNNELINCKMVSCSPTHYYLNFLWRIGRTWCPLVSILKWSHMKCYSSLKKMHNNHSFTRLIHDQQIVIFGHLSKKYQTNRNWNHYNKKINLKNGDFSFWSD